MRLMSHKSNLLNTFFVFVTSINLYSQEISETSRYEYFKKSNYSLEELGYNKCDKVLFKESTHKKRNYPVVNDQVTPENFKYLLMNYMCYYPNKQYVYYEDLDFDKTVVSFLEKYSSDLPHCDDSLIKDKCFGADVYHAGLYIGEWHDNLPNGKGVALITRNFPTIRRTREQNKEALYEGDFKNGYPHGYGFYQNGWDTYEGSWVNGERHGEIGWYVPRVFVYGLFYERDIESELIKITSITKGSSAENNEIAEGDLIYAIQQNNRDEIQKTNEITFEEFQKILKESKDIILYVNKPQHKVILKKSFVDVSFKNFSECGANINKEHGCFEKALLINKYTEKNTPYDYVRGSFYMGDRHMYHSNDFHSYTYSDNNPQGNYLKVWCHSQSLPFLVSNLDPRNNPIPLEGNPNVFVPRNFEDAPCGYGNILLYPELILDNDIFFEQAWKEVKSNSNKYIKIDFIGILEKAVNDKNNLQLFDQSKITKIKDPSNSAGGSSIDIYSGAHELCALSVTISKRACFYLQNTKITERVIDRLRDKVVLNPLTIAHENMLSIKLKRAKYNVGVIKFCKEQELNKDVPNDYVFTGCIFDKVHNSHTFWKCKYYGYADYTCLKESSGSFKLTYGNINDFIKNHPEQFENIDYNKWVFGKELEL